MSWLNFESKDTPSDVHAATIYPRWTANAIWRDKLAEKATKKALDIPDDDVNINTRSGMTWKELAVLGVIALGCTALAGDALRPVISPSGVNNNVTVPQAPAPAPVTPSKQNFGVKIDVIPE